jgi:hypothetical protein
LEGKSVYNKPIFACIKTYTSDGADTYAWILNSCTSYNSGATFYNQPDAMKPSANLIQMPSSKNPFDYLFIVTPRSIKVITKINHGATNDFYDCYLGSLNSFRLPTEWDSPMVIGGSSVCNAGGIPIRFDNSVVPVHSFWKPIDSYTTDIPIQFNHVGTLAVRDHMGQYQRPLLSNSGLNGSTSGGTWPFCEEIRTGAYNGLVKMRKNLDNTYSALPLLVVHNGEIYGEFDGVYYSTGHDLVSENTVTINGVDYIVLQTTDVDVVLYKLA